MCTRSSPYSLCAIVTPCRVSMCGAMTVAVSSTSAPRCACAIASAYSFPAMPLCAGQYTIITRPSRARTRHTASVIPAPPCARIFLVSVALHASSNLSRVVWLSEHTSTRSLAGSPEVLSTLSRYLYIAYASASPISQSGGHAPPHMPAPTHLCSRSVGVYESHPPGGRSRSASHWIPSHTPYATLRRPLPPSLLGSSRLPSVNPHLVKWW